MSSIVSLGNHKIVARLLQNAKKNPCVKIWACESDFKCTAQAVTSEYVFVAHSFELK